MFYHFESLGHGFINTVFLSVRRVIFVFPVISSRGTLRKNNKANKETKTNENTSLWTVIGAVTKTILFKMNWWKVILNEL